MADKMLFYSDASKQSQFYFLINKSTTSYETLFFNKLQTIRKNIQQHLGLILDIKLSFLAHIN